MEMSAERESGEPVGHAVALSHTDKEEVRTRNATRKAD
jgi:hypothetical protein